MGWNCASCGKEGPGIRSPGSPASSQISADHLARSACVQAHSTGCAGDPKARTDTCPALKGLAVNEGTGEGKQPACFGWEAMEIKCYLAVEAAWGLFQGLS